MLEFAPLTQADYHHALAATVGIAVVVFSGPDCGACRRLEALLPQALAGVAQALFRVDVQRSTGLARQYDVLHLPTLFRYRDGRFHAILEREATPAALRQAIAVALTRPPQEEP